MKKILRKASVLAFFWSAAQAQISADSSASSRRKLTFEEANLVMSYYRQSGDNAAVTGGIGSEALTNLAAGFHVRFTLLDPRQRKHTFSLDANLEKYTSASSDKVDPSTISSASRTDEHFYPSLAWTRKNEKTGRTVGATAAYSTEFDYKSYGASMHFAQATPDNNAEFSVKASVFLDQWKVILPVELRPVGYPSGGRADSEGIPYKPRNTYILSLGYSRVINPNLQLLFLIDPAFQEGLLGTPFHRVYFHDNSLRVEKLPGTRFKIPASIRANYFAGDKTILRGHYRFYTDTWGISAHTTSVEAALKATPFFSIIPHYRFTAQGGAKHFAPHKTHLPTAEFYTSDYDLSKFNSHFGGLGIRVATPGGVLGIKDWKSIEIRYGYYHRTNGLNAHILSLSSQLK